MKFEKEENYFPAGRMRVLAVDDNSDDLEALLLKCQYLVTSIKDATTALQILRQNKNEFDLVISEFHLPDMDVFELLEELTLRMDIPVVLTSWDDDKEKIKKAIIHGACDYLLKPVRIEELKNLWQHVVRKKINSNGSSGACSSSVCKNSRNEQKTIVKEELDQHHHEEEAREYVDDRQPCGVMDEEEILPPKQKKPRVVWIPELHHKFVAAVHQMGIDKAVPKRILEMMNVEGITREHVASHLQKYRMGVKKSDKEANAKTQQDKPMLSSFSSGTYYGQIDSTQAISRQCVSCPPVSHYLNNSVMMDMHQQIHKRPTTPIEMFTDDLSVTFDFANDNSYENSLLDEHMHWSQDSNNLYAPTSTTSSPASHLLLPMIHNMNYDSGPSQSNVVGGECTPIEFDNHGDDDDFREQASGAVTRV